MSYRMRVPWCHRCQHPADSFQWETYRDIFGLHAFRIGVECHGVVGGYSLLRAQLEQLVDPQAELERVVGILEDALRTTA